MEDENWRSAASGQSSAHTPTMKPRLLGESCEFVLLISVKNNPQTSALVPLSSKQIRTTQSDTLRPSGRTWPLTPTPPMAQKKAHEDWMGHAAKVDDTDSPSHQQQAVLTCPSRPGGRLACANVWRISFRRGESYGGAWAFTVGKKRKEEEKHSIKQHSRLKHLSQRQVCAPI